jgi:Ca-activated chloride channel homolog
MSNAIYFRRLKVCGISALATLVIAGCAAPAVQEPTTTSDESSGDGNIEEIIVTGSRAQNARQRLMSPADRKSVAGAYQTYSGPPPALPLANPDEEIWIIARSAPVEVDSLVDDSPGSGTMLATIADKQEGQANIENVPLPLTHTNVTAKIDGYISSVTVRQQFENPYSSKIEAIYMFPLPENSAVSEFLMTIGERKIRGILREKEEAVAIYRQARAQGYQASLLVQHRPNVFEQKVANIEPGKAIDIDIQYFHSLSYRDGWYSFVFPTVVGPRFNPPGTTNPISAIANGSNPQSPDAAAVSYLRPEERSAHDISISVDIDAGVDIEQLRSSHEIVTSVVDGFQVSVELAKQTAMPNRDFILDFKVAGDTVRSSLLAHKEPGSDVGHFTLMLYPPAALESLPRQAMELVFVLDTSGSMSGRPIEQAKAAVAGALSLLTPADTFQIIRFSDNTSQFGTEPVSATVENIAIARQYLRYLNGSGSTMMIEGLKAALDFPHDPSRLRIVSFLTDGYIGNEQEIIGAVHERIGESRIFSFGVGSSVNRYLLERMAKEGRGAVAFLGPQDSGAEVMSDFFNRVAHPAMTDLQIGWGGMSVTDVYPANIPDLFVGRPVIIVGKYRGKADSISVSGLAANETQQFILDAPRDENATQNVSKVWARLRIADLSDRQSWQPDPDGELAISIKNTALKYQLMSSYTSFVAVDASRQTAGDHGTTVRQAVPVPDGVRYDTTVEDNR